MSMMDGSVLSKIHIHAVPTGSASIVGSSSRLKGIKGKASTCRSPVDATVDVAFSVSVSESSFRSAQEGPCDLGILRAATWAISVNALSLCCRNILRTSSELQLKLAAPNFMDWTNVDQNLFEPCKSFQKPFAWARWSRQFSAARRNKWGTCATRNLTHRFTATSTMLCTALGHLTVLGKYKCAIWSYMQLYLESVNLCNSKLENRCTAPCCSHNQLL